MNKNVPPEVSAFFREIGRKNGKKLLEERGPEYFRKIQSMRKTHGRQKKVEIPQIKPDLT
jgi:hypothetical protein